MSDTHFDSVWSLVVSLQGEQFETKTGLPFTYEVRGNSLYTSRTRFNIARSEFKRAIELGPLDGPRPIHKLVRGPSYVWAILHDPRVKHVAWPEVYS